MSSLARFHPVHHRIHPDDRLSPSIVVIAVCGMVLWGAVAILSIAAAVRLFKSRREMRCRGRIDQPRRTFSRHFLRPARVAVTSPTTRPEPKLKHAALSVRRRCRVDLERWRERLRWPRRAGPSVLLVSVFETAIDISPMEEVVDACLGPDMYSAFYERHMQVQMLSTVTSRGTISASASDQQSMLPLC